jgi:serine/threonine-protein kinase RIO1
MANGVLASSNLPIAFWSTETSKNNPKFNGTPLKTANQDKTYITVWQRCIGTCKSIYKYLIRPIVDVVVFIGKSIKKVALNIYDTLSATPKAWATLEVRFIRQTASLQNEIEVTDHKLGTGMSANVYLGKYKDDHVAIKIMDKKTHMNTQISFEKEVKNLLLVQEDNRFIKIIAAYENQDSYVIVTECAGMDCETILINEQQKECSLNIAQLGYLLIETAECVKGLFDNRMINTDLSFKNLLSSDDGIKICDLSSDKVSLRTTFRTTYCGVILCAYAGDLIYKNMCIYSRIIYPIICRKIKREELKREIEQLQKKILGLKEKAEEIKKYKPTLIMPEITEFKGEIREIEELEQGKEAL